MKTKDSNFLLLPVLVLICPHWTCNLRWVSDETYLLIHLLCSLSLISWVLLTLLCVIRAEKSTRKNILQNMSCYSHQNKNDSVKYCTGSIHWLDHRWATAHLSCFHTTSRQVNHPFLKMYWLSGGPSHSRCIWVVICFSVGEATSGWVAPRYPSYLAKLTYR